MVNKLYGKVVRDEIVFEEFQEEAIKTEETKENED